MDILLDLLIIILNLIVPLLFIKDLRQRLISLKKKLKLINTPINRGVTRAITDKLIIN